MATTDAKNLGDFTALDIEGREVSLADYVGSVTLIVNTASKCGFTPQYAGLEALFEQYGDRGFNVLGFPCNQFGRQEPGAETQIAEFCERNYGVTFPMFAKIDVNGSNTHPLFAWLKTERPGLLGGAIKWNFTKFLVDKEGRVVQRYAPKTEPAAIAPDVEALLAK